MGSLCHIASYFLSLMYVYGTIKMKLSASALSKLYSFTLVERRVV